MRDIKVGLFVLAGLLLAALVIFLIGDERRLFEQDVEFRTSFPDVQGLKAGAPVRMGGIDVGHVTEVGYGTDPGDTTVYVRLSIVSSEASRIKTDAEAKIAAKGLLGDKLVEITVGESGESIPVGGEIPGQAPSDMLGKVGGMADKAEVAIDNIAKVTGELADEEFHRDIRESASSINIVLDQIANGEGYPNRFLRDPAEAERISQTVASLEKATSELSSTLAESRAVIRQVRQGPGFAHEIVYGEGPQPQIEQFGEAAHEFAVTLRGVREGDGIAHDMLFGGEGDGADALKNITLMTADLRDIVADMKAGKGTIGALLVDPSVYEDVKLVLGNVQRNDVLRALVRYSIKQDEKAPTTGVSTD